MEPPPPPSAVSRPARRNRLAFAPPCSAQRLSQREIENENQNKQGMRSQQSRQEAQGREVGDKHANDPEPRRGVSPSPLTRASSDGAGSRHACSNGAGSYPDSLRIEPPAPELPAENPPEITTAVHEIPGVVSGFFDYDMLDSVSKQAVSGLDLLNSVAMAEDFEVAYENRDAPELDVSDDEVEVKPKRIADLSSRPPKRYTKKVVPVSEPEYDSDSGDEDSKWLDELLIENGVELPPEGVESAVTSVSALTSLSGETPVRSPVKDSFPTPIEAASRKQATKLRMPRAARGNKHIQGIFDQQLHQAKQYMSPFIEKRPAQSLRPLGLSDEWEYVEAILDSGATVTVIPPHIGKGYEITPGEASRAGVMYEVANGEEIPNLGEKLLPIMTLEGNCRGMRAQVADVSKPLQAVRSLVRTGHLVVFGDGEDGTQSYVINKATGEVMNVKDDGVNYLMGMYVIPRAEAGFGRPAATP